MLNGAVQSVTPPTAVLLMPPPQLPVEIWSQIVSYLTKDDIVKIYCVNRVLYAISQNIRFEEVRIERVTRGLISKLLYFKRSPETAGCTTSLVLNIEAFRTLNYSRSRGKKILDSTLRLILNRSGSKDFSMLTHKSACEVFDILSDVVTRMDNLRNMHVTWYPWSSVHKLQRNEGKLWDLISGRITSLTVHRLLPRHVDWFSATYKDLSALTSLSLRLYAHEMESWTESECVQVARLISSVQGTLESLALDTSASMLTTPVGFIFEHLDRFECLGRIDLCTKTDASSIQIVVAFLNLHSHCLKELSIRLTYHYGEASFISRLNLPSLRKLHLCFEYVLPEEQDLWTGTLRFDELEELSFATECSPSGVENAMCDAFQRSGIGHRLRHLSLMVWSFYEDSLETMVSLFPQLRTLTIYVYLPFDYPRDNFPLSPIQTYPEWTLYDLTIFQVRYRSDDYYPSYEAMRQVANRFVSIRSFCGNGHMDELRPVE